MRHKLDAYYTPDHATQALLRHVKVEGKVLEPCNGEGAITSILLPEDTVKNVITNDIDTSKAADHHMDARGHLLYDLEGNADWIVTNPPFNCAIEILSSIWSKSSSSIAMLLRLSFLEPTKDRKEFLQTNPPDLLIVLPRISFTGDGKTDSCTTAWFVWYRGDQENKTGI